MRCAANVLSLGFLCCAGFHSTAAQGNQSPATPNPKAVPGAGLFIYQSIPRLRITITPDNIARLRSDSRRYVPAVVQDGQETFERVAVHLKGATGSFQPIDDKPALTLNFNKFAAGQNYCGLSKIHLNNSVEDPSYLNELAGAELFRRAGVPAPRVTHALVELNGRRLGLYVLKEGFAEEFLGLHFRKPKGNLYDTGVGHDVDEALEKDRGDGPDDRSDLRALTSAAREPDPAKRWQALGQTLDLDRFLSFMAMEVIACHRDGYSLARNNFRVYHDPGADRMVFLPHGMDQLFGRPDATIHPVMAGLVARAVVETPEGRRAFRERLARLTSDALCVTALQQQADAFLKRAKPVVESREFRELEQAVATVKERISQRKKSLLQQLSEPEPSPIRFEDGVARLAAWQAVDAPAGGTMDQTTAPDGRRALHIRAGPATSASWRTKVILPKGSYRFEAAARTKGVLALSFGKNKGAGLRAVGGTPSPPCEFVGDHDWTKLQRPFEIEADQEVELICELRARAGEVWFDLESLRVVEAP